MRSPEQPHLTLTECEEMMRDLQDKYPVEYKAYGLSSVAVAIMFPLIKTSLNVGSASRYRDPKTWSAIKKFGVLAV